jgi:hypothetical protein
MAKVTYPHIERQLVERLPELRPAAEYYWQVEGEPGSDSGPYIFFESMFGSYVTILLAMPQAPGRDRLLQRAFDFAEAMLVHGDDQVRHLAFIGLLESRGAWWWRRAEPFMGPAAKREVETYEPAWRSGSADVVVDDPMFIDMYGVRSVIARELAEDGISLDRVPGATHARDAR